MIFTEYEWSIEMTDRTKRINELAKKAREVGLTEEEKAEQKALREQYIKEFRQGVRNTLDNVYTLDANGNKVPLKKYPQV